MALNVGIIAGIVVGLAAIGGLFVVLWRAKKSQQQQHQHELSHSKEERRGKDVPDTVLPVSTQDTRSNQNLDDDDDYYNQPQQQQQHQKSKPRLSLFSMFGSRAMNDDDEGGGGDQSSFSTIDYDYAKAHNKANGGGSIVSSVGGTLGGNTLEDLNNTNHHHHEEATGRAAALGGGSMAVAAAETTKTATTAANSNSSLLYAQTSSISSGCGADYYHDYDDDQDYIFVAKVGAGQKLGLVVHSAHDNDGSIKQQQQHKCDVESAKNNDSSQNLPVVHAIKDDSPLKRQGVRVGDCLMLVNQTNVRGMTALQVSQQIRNNAASGEATTLTLMRPKITAAANSLKPTTKSNSSNCKSKSHGDDDDKKQQHNPQPPQHRSSAPLPLPPISSPPADSIDAQEQPSFDKAPLRLSDHDDNVSLKEVPIVSLSVGEQLQQAPPEQPQTPPTPPQQKRLPNATEPQQQAVLTPNSKKSEKNVLHQSVSLSEQEVSTHPSLRESAGDVPPVMVSTSPLIIPQEGEESSTPPTTSTKQQVNHHDDANSPHDNNHDNDTSNHTADADKYNNHPSSLSSLVSSQGDDIVVPPDEPC